MTMDCISLCVIVKEVEKRGNDMKFLSMLKRMLGADHTKEANYVHPFQFLCV